MLGNIRTSYVRLGLLGQVKPGYYRLGHVRSGSIRLCQARRVYDILGQVRLCYNNLIMVNTS
jgi:hypothetical protein